MFRRLSAIRVRGVIVFLGVLALLVILPNIFMNISTISLYKFGETTVTVKRLESYVFALRGYYKQYGCYPYACTNIEELVYVLDGQNLRGCNSNNISFFSHSVEPLCKKELFRNGFGKPFLLFRNPDGTNLTIRSMGDKSIDYERQKHSYRDLDTRFLIKQPEEY